MYSHKVTIRLHDTDAAGVLYFANQLRIAHDAFEAFLQSAGISMDSVLHGPCYFPVVHAEADFTHPVIVGDVIAVEVGVERLGETSFTIRYNIRKDGNISVGGARIVHVAVDAKTKQKRALPDELRAVLQKIS